MSEHEIEHLREQVRLLRQCCDDYKKSIEAATKQLVQVNELLNKKNAYIAELEYKLKDFLPIG